MPKGTALTFTAADKVGENAAFPAITVCSDKGSTDVQRTTVFSEDKLEECNINRCAVKIHLLREWHVAYW